MDTNDSHACTPPVEKREHREPLQHACHLPKETSPSQNRTGTNDRMAIADEVFLFRKLGPAILRDRIGPGGERAHEDLPLNSGGGSSPLHGECAFYVRIHCAGREVVRGVYHHIDTGERTTVDRVTHAPRHCGKSLGARTARSCNYIASFHEPCDEIGGDESVQAGDKNLHRTKSARTARPILSALD